MTVVCRGGRVSSTDRAGQGSKWRRLGAVSDSGVWGRLDVKCLWDTQLRVPLRQLDTVFLKEEIQNRDPNLGIGVQTGLQVRGWALSSRVSINATEEN